LFLLKRLFSKNTESVHVYKIQSDFAGCRFVQDVILFQKNLVLLQNIPWVYRMGCPPLVWRAFFEPSEGLPWACRRELLISQKILLLLTPEKNILAVYTF